jgi:hypothetical protein
VSGATKRESVNIGLVLIEWAAVDVDHRSVVVCYDRSVSHGLSLSLIICIQALGHHFFCKPIFKGEFDPRFVTLFSMEYKPLYTHMYTSTISVNQSQHFYTFPQAKSLINFMSHLQEHLCVLCVRAMHFCHCSLSVLHTPQRQRCINLLPLISRIFVCATP